MSRFRWWWTGLRLWTMFCRCGVCGAWPTRMTYVEGRFWQDREQERWLGLWACRSCHGDFADNRVGPAEARVGNKNLVVRESVAARFPMRSPECYDRSER